MAGVASEKPGEKSKEKGAEEILEECREGEYAEGRSRGKGDIDEVTGKGAEAASERDEEGFVDGVVGGRGVHE